MKRILLFSLFLISLIAAQSQTCPTSGAVTISANPDTYFPGTQANVNAGATSITLGAASSGAAPITAGDIVLIIQMQGAEIDSTDTETYGSGNTGDGGTVSRGWGYLNNANHLAGNMEFAIAANSVPLAGGTLNITAGTGKMYRNSNFGPYGQYRYQVIRVPIYYDAALGANIVAPAWNGTTGGVITIQAKNNFSFAGFTIDASEKGFRGGGGRMLTGGSAAPDSSYRTFSSINFNGSKGEGTAGTPRFLNNNGVLLDNVVEGYPAGSYARGAPGNSGGGGTDGDINSNSYNSGGAGGGNGGEGGAGGRTSTSDRSIGGENGHPFDEQSATRVVMGGGGGAGTTDNGTGALANGLSSSGAAGGGIAILVLKNITSAGTINVNGANADNTVTTDGSGGGGAGGSVLLFGSSGFANVTVLANGGNGGTNTGGGVASYGPGGGGGGGVVYSSGILNAASSVAKGLRGHTASAASYGARSGADGILAEDATIAQAPANTNTCAILPVKLISFTDTKQNLALLLQWKVTDELNVKEYIIEKSFDGSNFLFLDKVASQNSTFSIKDYSYADNAINHAVIFYRLKIMDNDGNYSYSNIILFKQNKSNADLITVFPNPVTNSAANIFIPQQLVNKSIFIRVIGEDGKTLSLEKQVPVTNIVNLNFSKYLHGIVLVQVSANNDGVLYSDKVLVK